MKFHTREEKSVIQPLSLRQGTCTINCVNPWAKDHTKLNWWSQPIWHDVNSSFPNAMPPQDEQVGQVELGKNDQVVKKPTVSRAPLATKIWTLQCRTFRWTDCFYLFHDLNCFWSKKKKTDCLCTTPFCWVLRDGVEVWSGIMTGSSGWLGTLLVFWTSVWLLL